MKIYQSNRKLLSPAMVMVGVVIALALGSFLVLSFFSPPKEFPEETIVTVKSGQSVREIAENLEDQKIIRNSWSLLGVLKFMYPDNAVLVAGDYLFERPMPLLHVIERIRTGDFGDSRIRITIFEGTTRAGMAEVFSEQLPQFNADEFMRKTASKEGYLFPDTYLFFPTTKTSEVIAVMEDRFEDQIAELLPEIEASDKTLEDIVIMASVIEREAYGRVDSFIISGILWERIRRGMLLQVDAPFVYLFGKGSAQLTRADLATDSPYNTYIYKGLPPGPISNPGRLALEAAIRPESSPYLFYLHGSDGQAHYAKTFEGHLSNKRAYID